MPELPEAETIARYLAPLARGRRIIRAEVYAPRVLRDYKNPAEIIQRLEGRRIVDVLRRGKTVALRLSGEEYLLVHLGMSGRLLWNPAAGGPHDRMALFLSGGGRLVFNDARQFGRCRLAGSLEDIAGKEALEIRIDEMRGIFARRKGAIKPLLMNQKIIAGIGNIYADEILWRAGVHPLRLASELDNKEARALWNSMRRVLALGIRHNGSSMQSYRLPGGEPGGYYAIRKAYRRAGEPCAKDGAMIQRIVIAQRSAYFCPIHQQYPIHYEA